MFCCCRQDPNPESPPVAQKYSKNPENTQILTKNTAKKTKSNHSDPPARALSASSVKLLDSVDLKMADNLAALVSRLEAVTSRLESVAGGGGSGPAASSGKNYFVSTMNILVTIFQIVAPLF